MSSLTPIDAAQDVLHAIQDATELPNPSYVLQSSPGRAHLFWRVRRFTCDTVEALEKHLARKLGTDPAATACTQLTRLPGFVNHKRATPCLVAIEYRDVRPGVRTRRLSDAAAAHDAGTDSR